MDTSLLIYVLVGAAFAGFVQGLSGFAFGMVAMAFWAWSVSPQLAGPLVVACSFLGQLLSIGSARSGFALRLVAPFVLGGALGVPLGAALLPRVDQTLFKAAIGMLLVVWCPTMLLARELPRVNRGGAIADSAVGIIGGVMGGLGGLPGPVPTLWCTLRGWDKDVQRAVFQTFNLAMHTFTLTVYGASGFITGQTLVLFAGAAPAMLVPVLLGARLYAGLSGDAFRRVVLVLLLLSGVALLAASLPRLW
jgi:uncharacterized membrane protein YfcA